MKSEMKNVSTKGPIYDFNISKCSFFNFTKFSAKVQFNNCTPNVTNVSSKRKNT